MFHCLASRFPKPYRRLPKECPHNGDHELSDGEQTVLRHIRYCVIADIASH